MARKPKFAPSIEPELSIDEVQPSPDETSSPARRGRKKKSAAAAELAPADETAEAAAQPLPTTDTPARGRKSPGRRKAERPSLLDQALEQQPEPETSSGPAAEPASAGDDTMIAEMAYPVSTDDTAAPPSDATPQPPPHDAPSAKSAAQWDRATDTVQFDWTEIERTASQDGPNQVMAKLLVAARAEGANSRWPL